MPIVKVPYNGEWAITESPSAVRFTEQDLTETEKARARANIGALGEGDYITNSEIDALCKDWEI